MLCSGMAVAGTMHEGCLWLDGTDCRHTYVSQSEPLPVLPVLVFRQAGFLPEKTDATEQICACVKAP